jgi:hypothetical protein
VEEHARKSGFEANSIAMHLLQILANIDYNDARGLNNAVQVRSQMLDKGRRVAEFPGKLRSLANPCSDMWKPTARNRYELPQS